MRKIDPELKKALAAIRQRRWYMENRERQLKESHEYYRKNRERVLAREKRRRDSNPEKMREIARRVIAKDPEKNRCRKRFEYHMRRGHVIKPKHCSECGGTQIIQAHHHMGYSYENTLNVVWLCSRCHGVAHHT